MTETTTNSNLSSNMQRASASAADLRCSHRTQRGSRCRLPVSDPASGLCSRHSRAREYQIDRADLSAELLGDLREFESPDEVHTFLSRLLVLLAQNRVSTRRAAVFCYICAQLLRTFREIDRNASQPQIMMDFDSACARRAAGLLPIEPDKSLEPCAVPA